MTAGGLLLLVVTLPHADDAHHAFAVPALIAFEAGMLALGALLIAAPRLGAPAAPPRRGARRRRGHAVRRLRRRAEGAHRRRRRPARAARLARGCPSRSLASRRSPSSPPRAASRRATPSRSSPARSTAANVTVHHRRHPRVRRRARRRRSCSPSRSPRSRSSPPPRSSRPRGHGAPRGRRRLSGRPPHGREASRRGGRRMAAVGRRRALVAEIEAELDALVDAHRRRASARRSRTSGACRPTTLARAVRGNVARALAALRDAAPADAGGARARAARRPRARRAGPDGRRRPARLPDLDRAPCGRASASWRASAAPTSPSVLAFSRDAVAVGRRGDGRRRAPPTARSSSSTRARSSSAATRSCSRCSPARSTPPSCAARAPTFGLDPEREYVPFRARARATGTHAARHRIALALAGDDGLVTALDHDLAGIAARPPASMPGVAVGVGPARAAGGAAQRVRASPAARCRPRSRSARRARSRLADLSIRPAILADEALGDAFAGALPRAARRARAASATELEDDAAHLVRPRDADRGHRARAARAPEHAAPPAAPLRGGHGRDPARPARPRRAVVGARAPPARRCAARRGGVGRCPDVRSDVPDPSSEE